MSAKLTNAAAPRDTALAAVQSGLIYTTDAHAGIRRVKQAEGFSYVLPNGKPVTDEKTLARIRSLAIPPAYEDVWICRSPKGHLQATGRDARGRKQYRYHPLFRESQDGGKFERLAAFAKALPRIHERIDEDLRRHGLPREKVLAVVVHLLERSFIRVGNEEYARTNRSYGLTTLLSRHVKIEGSDVRFRFLGKSKVQHDVALHDRRLARIVGKLQGLPGQVLFQYLDEHGETHSVNSTDVNAYLREVAGGKFTAKDFRTWAGTVLAIGELVTYDPPKTKREFKGATATAIKTVAEQLRNTPAVCRKCYIHPAVLEAYEAGTLRRYLRAEGTPEEAVVRLLRGRRAKNK